MIVERQRLLIREAICVHQLAGLPPVKAEGGAGDRPEERHARRS